MVRLPKLFRDRFMIFRIRRSSDPMPMSVKVLANSGYVGLEKIHKKTILQRKQKRGTQVNPKGLKHNEAIGMKRIKVERTFKRL